MTLPCPTCGDRVPCPEAEHGDIVTCPACEGQVTVKLAPRVSRPMPALEPPRVLAKSLGFTLGLFLALAGFCGLAGYVVYDHLADPEFTPYTDQAGRFRVEFPSRKVSHISPMTWTMEGPVTFPAVVYERTVPDDSYMVAWIDLPPERLAAGEEFILNEACTGASVYNPMVTKEISRVNVTVQGRPGCEMIYAVRGTQGKGILRVVISGKRLYLLFVGGGFIQADSERARHFLDSFVLW